MSKGRASQKEHLVRDVAYLREQTRKQEKAFGTLKKEHDSLKTKTITQTQELEKVKQENEKLRNALKLANVSGQVLSDTTPSLTGMVQPELVGIGIENEKPKNEDTDSGVNVEQRTHLKVGDKVLSLHKGWAYYTATIVHFDSDTLMYTVDWDDGDPTGRAQKYHDVALDKTPAEDEIGVGTLVLFPQVGDYSISPRNLAYCGVSFIIELHRSLQIAD